MSYGVKTGMHLGVDALIRLFPKPLFQGRRHLSAPSAPALCADAAALPAGCRHRRQGSHLARPARSVTGRSSTPASASMICAIRSGCRKAFGLQERVQRWIAYLMLPIGLGLFAFRSLQAMFSHLPAANAN
jgi:C4-dicarboxylate transporter DctQ subunit